MESEHPQLTAVMEQFQKFTGVLEDQMRQKNTGAFTAVDDTETVEVSINGDGCLTHLHLEDGLLRLGAQTVEDRINDALQKAHASATENFEAQYEQTVDALSGIVSSMQDILSAS